MELQKKKQDTVQMLANQSRPRQTRFIKAVLQSLERMQGKLLRYS